MIGRFRWDIPQQGAAAYAFRLTAAALGALVLAQSLKVALPLWSVLTALIVTQISLGRSLRATLDYFAATLGGVLWGGAVAVFVPHGSESSLLLVLFLALAPLAFAAALYPRLAVGPVTAAIVVLIPQMMHTTPIDSAIERVSEVLIGGLAGLFVSFVLLPLSAFQHTREVAAEAVQRMAKAVPGLITGFGEGLDAEEAHRLQDGIGQRLSELASIVAEAERERPLRLSADPFTGPLFRTLMRLRHDLVIMGRAARYPIPASLKASLHAPLNTVGEEIGRHLQACSSALKSKSGAPDSAKLDAALTLYASELEALRRAGKLRRLPMEALEQLLATSFALDQTRFDLRDLNRCVDEWAGDPR